MAIFVNSIKNLDLQAFYWLNSWAGFSSFIDWTIVFRAVYLWYVVVAAIVLFAITPVFVPRFRNYLRKNIELLIFAFASAFTARFVVTEIIRFFYNRPRPFVALEGVRVLQHQLFYFLNAADKSFPSGHAALAFAVAAAVSFYYPKTSILFFIAALNIGLARVAAGAHWPSDILGGAIVGIGTAMIFHAVWKKYKNK